MNITDLDELYLLYRFEVLPISNANIRIYSHTSRYYSNADVVILNNKVDRTEIDSILDEVTNLGFSVKERNYQTIIEVENSLFDGFFDITASNRNLLRGYNNYKRKIEDVLFGPYVYINSEYTDEEANIIKTDSITSQIISDLALNGPVLIMLEAAAGFGKTSTSFEVLKHLVERPNTKQIPLFTELSRNRQASIFKYVLYDEINRQFTGSSLELVTKHITEGRIPVIIDGFDELLKGKNNKDQPEESFEDAEPMLETIKDLLKGEAKIILTTRRTAIFSDNEFYGWLEKNSENFTFRHYTINEPTISHWISVQRQKELEKAGLNLRSISNPVLLSYLRSMDDDEFQSCLQKIDEIINSYIERLMQREKQRQDLRMTVEEQRRILRNISKYFTRLDITSENRETLERFLIDENTKLFIEVIERYPSSEKPSLDQLVNKLVIHAFFDRKGDNGQQIGFVNEFILGSFVGENLLEEKELWIGSERFLDFILTSYIPRESDTKKKIYNILNRQLIELLSQEKCAYIDNYLFGSLNHDIENVYISELEFRNKFANKITIRNVFFSDCEFYEIDFDFTNTSNVSFINCTFYNCRIQFSEVFDKNIDFTNCLSNENSIPFDELQFKHANTDDSLLESNTSKNNYEKKVLEKFWPTGKERFTPHKRPGTLRLGVPTEDIGEVDIAIERLKKRNILIEQRGHHSLALNIEHINEVKQILGR